MWELIVRSIFIFVLLLLLMRVLGKRQLGELELNELIVSVLMADLAAAPMQDLETPLLQGLTPLLTLFFCELLTAQLTVRSVKLRALVCGKPVMLIRDGKILQKQMHSCRFTIDELAEELRQQGFMDFSGIKFAVLETDGTLSAIPYAQDAPVTARQLGVESAEDGYPYIVINEGRVLSDNLHRAGQNECWLREELTRRNAKSPKEVYLMVLYESGRVYYAAKNEA